ncbi:uncharacterized protein LOC144909632 [Branchiostoma floridae x Branchiostoma belcheri]
MHVEMAQRPVVKSGDVQRALICSGAACWSDPLNADTIKKFLEGTGVRDGHDFVEVNVKRERNSDGGEVRYLVAETRNREEVFVAFKGTTEFKDVMDSLSIWQEGGGQSRDNNDVGVGGKYHKGFKELAFLVPAQSILEKYSDSRIVVCGHSLGGAVAHIVALNMMACLLKEGKKQQLDKVTSIAFGAPYFGNDGAQQFAEKHNFSPRLLTIVNEEDPVPYILRLAETIQCAGQTVLKKVKTFSDTAKPIVLGILDLLSAVGMSNEKTSEGAKDNFSKLSDKLDECKTKLQEWGLTAKDLDSLYVPLGWYLCIRSSKPEAGDGTVWKRTLWTNPGQHISPDIRDWKEEDFQSHSLAHYLMAFYEVTDKKEYQVEGTVEVTAHFEEEKAGDPTLVDMLYGAASMLTWPLTAAWNKLSPKK